MATKPIEVAIIGAGLAGCFLAIALHEYYPLPACKINIYESRPSSIDEQASGVILTPNGLRVLDRLGIFSRIKETCWTAKYRTYKNDKDETTRRVLITSQELYGFENHRIYRRVLLRVIKDILAERGIQVHYNSRFERFDSYRGEHGDQVSFIVNGETRTTDLLVGADGIYSSVRKQLEPSIVPEYTGTVGVFAHIKWSSVDWPSADYEHQCTVQAKPGAFFMIPETKDGSEVMVGMQMKNEDMSRADWDQFAADKDAMVRFFRRNYEQWHDTGKKVIDAVSAPPARDTLFLWPFLRMPRLRSWFKEASAGADDIGRGSDNDGDVDNNDNDSKSGDDKTGGGANVIILGDAAHAVPPSSGQGVNQALEDVWSLVLLLRQQQRPRRDALAFWQTMRQRRIDRVFDWATNATNVARMPEEERNRLIGEGKVPGVTTTTTTKAAMTNGHDDEPGGEKKPGIDFFDDMAWLYSWSADTEIEAWINDGQ